MNSVVKLPRMDEVSFNKACDKSFDEDEAKRMENLLGYSGLIEYNRGLKRLALKESNECILFEACVKVGIKPFQVEAVEKYQTSRAGTLWNRHKRLWWGFYPSMAALIIGSCFIETGMGVALPLVSGAFLAIFALVKSMIASDGKWVWRNYKLNDWKKEIPVGVLSMAAKLTEELPDVCFEVCSLEYNYRPADPFLVAKYKGAKLYIAVWNEPSFKAEYE